MNPVYNSENSLLCPICFEDKAGQTVLWHKKISIDARNHTSCLDCSSAYLKMAAQPFELDQRVNCPECRKDIIIINTNTVSRKLLSLALKASSCYLFFIYVGQPISLYFLHRLSPKNEISPLIDDWCYQQSSENSESLIQTQVAELILNGYSREIKKQMLHYVNYEYTTMLSFLMASTFYIYRDIFESSLTVKQKQFFIVCIFAQHIFYLFYHREIYNSKLDHVDRLSNYLWLNVCPIKNADIHVLSIGMKVFIAFIPIILMHINTVNKELVRNLTKERIQTDFLNGNIRFREA